MSKQTATIRYEDAIGYAAYDYCKFMSTFERVGERYKRGLHDTHLTHSMERDQAMQASATQAQQQLICHLFGKSEEDVHDALHAEWLKRKAEFVF